MRLLRSTLSGPVRRLRRRLRAVGRRYREARLVARAFQSDHHPILAQIVPMRRCNLSCAYCTEYDKTSAAVPLGEMLRRVDRLASLGTTSVQISGGEPLLHPELEAIVRRIRDRGMLAGLLTNGYLLTRQRIEALNRAGLDQLQISIDNVEPDEVSKKSRRSSIGNCSGSPSTPCSTSTSTRSWGSASTTPRTRS